jgi:hypothetical protein
MPFNRVRVLSMIEYRENLKVHNIGPIVQRIEILNASVLMVRKISPRDIRHHGMTYDQVALMVCWLEQRQE